MLTKCCSCAPVDTNLFLTQTSHYSCKVLRSEQHSQEEAAKNTLKATQLKAAVVLCRAQRCTAWLLGNSIDISFKRHCNRSHKKKINTRQVGRHWIYVTVYTMHQLYNFRRYTAKKIFSTEISINTREHEISLLLCVPMSISSHCNFLLPYLTLE